MTNKMTEMELIHLINQLNLDEVNDDSDKEKLSDVEAKEAPDKNKPTHDGWVQVKEQIIIVRDPQDNGKKPTISAQAPVKLRINNTEVDHQAAVSSTDEIHWEIEGKALFEVKISKDKLYVYFHLFSRQRYAWRLIDTEPVLHLVLTAEEDLDFVIQSVLLVDVVKELDTYSIKANLDFPAIQQELENPTFKPVIVARGKAPVPGEDARLDIYFSQQVKKQFYEVSGSVDFRNHLHIPSVSSGEVIARKIPIVEGAPGIDVYGDVLLPIQPKDLTPVLKSNVELTPDGEIIAKKEGRPRITGGNIKTFDISTAYVVPGNVDIETGNIVFSGDIIVYGNVSDNMIIESLGNVYIYGSVYKSTVTATGSIHIRGNVLDSNLYSGFFGVMFNRLYNASKSLSEEIEKLLAASQMLLQALELKKQEIRFGQIVLLLMENKCKGVPIAIKELLQVISNIEHLKKEDYQKLKDITAVFSQPLQVLERVTFEVMQDLLAVLQNTHKEIAIMKEKDVEININQCHKSRLKSNGNINIHRQGVLLSDLYSARNITFIDEAAVCRGSVLEAGESISAKVIGGQTSAHTVLKAKKQVTVLKMYAGRVCVGRYCLDIFEMIENKTFDMLNIMQRN